jgi:hypothetical protein
MEQMSEIDCNYQSIVAPEEYATALKEAVCEHCGTSARQLLQHGEILEVCGEEFLYDIVSGERVLSAIALCPTCHRRHHLDAQDHHNPCQIKARLSRERLD